MVISGGLSFQISQCSEGFLPECMRSKKWSSRETSRTIKSAPSRNPEVMTMLSTKSGWLMKRNSRDVWRKRWCCVVPHTFLYYFSEDMLKGGKDFNNEERMEYGIIDLEGYTSIEKVENKGRSSDKELIFELKGDSGLDPNLSSVVFKAESKKDLKEWKAALLHDRYSTVVDELEAYQEVCEGAARQVKQWSEFVQKANVDKSEKGKARNEDSSTSSDKEILSIVNKVVKTVKSVCEQKDEGSSQSVSDVPEATTQLNPILERMTSHLSRNCEKYVDSKTIVESVKMLAELVEAIFDKKGNMDEKITVVDENIINEVVANNVEDDKKIAIAEGESERSRALMDSEESEIDKIRSRNNLLEKELQEMRKKNAKLTREIEDTNRRNEIDKKTTNKKSEESKQKIKTLNHRIKLQASIIECMMNNKSDAARLNDGDEEKESKSSNEKSDEAYFEDESIFGVVSEWTEDVSGMFPRSNIVSSGSPARSTIPINTKGISDESKSNIELPDLLHSIEPTNSSEARLSVFQNNGKRGYNHKISTFDM